MLQAGETFERKYVVRELLGSGGFALVYRAEQPGVGRNVAIKILRSAEEIGTHPTTLLKRFQREARMAAELRHPSNIQLYDFGAADGGELYMVFEFIDGIPLDDLIRASGPMSVRRVVRILSQLLEALEEAHQLGILHRDVKPANVIIYERLGKKDRAKLIDYGIAKPMGKKEAGTGITAEGHVVGTPRYMAPEQILMLGELTPATDIYSLGLVAYEMLAGHSLLGTSTHTEVIKRQLSGEVFRVPPNVPAPPGLRAVVDKMLAKSARDRFQRADQVVAALQRVDLDEAYEPLPPVEQMLETLASDTVSSAEFVGRSPRSGDHADGHAPTLDSRPSIALDRDVLAPTDPTVDSFSAPAAEPPTVDRSAQAMLVAAQDRETRRGLRPSTILAGLGAAGLLVTVVAAMNVDFFKSTAHGVRDTVRAATSDCPDDEHEPNNRSADGTELTSVSRRAVLCPGDVDWYVLGFYNAGDLVRVGIQYDPGTYDIDMEMYVGATFEAGAWTPHPIETIERRISTTGVVAVRVYYPTVEGNEPRGYTITRDVDSLKSAAAGADIGEATGRVLHIARDDVSRFEYLADPDKLTLAESDRWEQVPEAVRSAVIVTIPSDEARPGHVLFTNVDELGEGRRLKIEEITVAEWTTRLAALASGAPQPAED